MTILVTWFGTSSSGGAERSTVELCNQLCGAAGVRRVILLFAHSSNKNQRLLDTQLAPAVFRYSIAMPFVLWRIVACFWVAYACLRHRVSIVQVNYRATLSESFGAWLCGCTVVGCLRIIPFTRRRVWSFIFLSHIVCVSSAVLRELRCLGWKGEATVIHNAVDVESFLRTGATAGDQECIRYYTLSRLVEWKRVDWFIRAAAIVHSRVPNAEFYVFGEGPMLASLAASVERMGLSAAIHLMGWAEPFHPSVRRCGIFVLPSFEEPFGRALVEAVLQRKVVVASSSGAVPELLPGHRLLFDRDDVDGLARAMLDATTHFEAFQSGMADDRRRFSAQFGLARLRREYIAIYNGLMTARVSHRSGYITRKPRSGDISHG
jgi:glycosyltransferase involved in cell wall biosynthesis